MSAPDEFMKAALLTRHDDDPYVMTMKQLRALLACANRRETLLRAALDFLSKTPMLDPPSADNACSDLAEHIAAELGAEGVRVPPPLMPVQHIGSLAPGKWALLMRPSWKRPIVGKRVEEDWIDEHDEVLDEPTVYWELPELLP